MRGETELANLKSLTILVWMADDIKAVFAQADGSVRSVRSKTLRQNNVGHGKSFDGTVLSATCCNSAFLGNIRKRVNALYSPVTYHYHKIKETKAN